MIVKGNKHHIVKSGRYSAKLTEVKTVQSGYGERIAFIFEITGGIYQGVKLARTCTPILKPNSNLTEIIQSLNHKPLSAEQIYDGIDVSQFQGNEYQIRVTQRESKNGFYYSHIEQII
ncbi:hypothetical protein ACVND7_12730 [Avibacterium paragallinarum]|uniref:DUF669 domain-containing protein n=1 Tax=Avibacterium paragallinarum TaxID=728 RepID=A0ABU7QIS9_AVIPA|nr:DUF669 domain-containing protein [Avibacterium paragallinarum]QZP15792.1 DUF669 domain-containing protein [Avibacterium paragallinarum]QZP16516.1 DUF669 domain-containing protein [Avibacterium paragallinarum]WAL57231.1 hypothetical protein OY678_02370 [Avibacterium paragallinarum]